MARWKDFELISKLIGKEYERTVQERAVSIFSDILKIKPIPPNKFAEEILPCLEEAEEKGEIDEEKKKNVLALDLIVKGIIKDKDKYTKREVVLAVEISYTLHKDDVERARERAQILSKVLNKEVIPAVVYAEIKEDVEKLLAKEEKIYKRRYAL